MATGKALFPLNELVALGEFPLAEYLPADELADIFDGLYYTQASADFDGVNLTLNLELAFERELSLALPGSDAIALVLGSGGVGWTFLPLRMVIGPDFEFSLVQLPISLRLPPDILKDVASGAPAQITVTCDLRIDEAGLRLQNLSGASLAPAYLCGTTVVVQAADVRPVFGYGQLPDWMDADPSFTGLAIQTLTVTVPSDLLQLDAGSALDISIQNAAIGTTGFSGAVSLRSADLQHPVSGTLLGFPFRFREFVLDIQQNALVDLHFAADLRLQALEDGGREKWIGVDLFFADNGTMAATLSAVQPSEASASAALVELEFPQVFRMEVTALRITQRAGVWSVFVSGGVQLLLSGAVAWPQIDIDEIGVDSTGKILLADGAGITFASPLVVNWHFVRLSITKFRFGYADDSGSRLQVGLSADVLLLEGLPAGASVEGLVVEWTPGSSAAPSVRLDGIGVEFGVPGCFQASMFVAYTESAGVIEFRGKGALALTALDMGVEIGVVVGYQSAPPPAFAFLYLFADAKLMPTGIPIGQTGLSIYGFQGLVAQNMALALDMGLPENERFYELFVRNPIGITDVNKWERRRGQNALGVGVVLGTADKGFCINVKGLLVIAFPDLTLLLQAKANFLQLKPDLSTAQEGTLDALMVYASGQNTLSLDIVAHWGIPVLVTVQAQARAFFSFTNPSAWYLEIGRDEDAKRATAQVIEWNGAYLFAAGFWFRLDANGVITGAQVDLELRAESGGFWVEAVGHARGEMALYWQPAQWEGSLELAGRIGAGYRGASVSASLNGNARARTPRPMDVHIRVEACVRVLVKFCSTFNFDWKQVDPPSLEAPVRGWAAAPRHWTPREQATSSAQGALDTGVVALAPGTVTTPTIQPHSVISLDFAKPMVDATALFNEAVALDDGGFVTIGRDSGWSACFRLDTVTLLQDPDGTATTVPLWGTWARETLLPNTTLRLNSSVRYGDEGSLTFGYLEGATLDYCDPPKTSRRCVDVTGVEPGYTVLDDGSLVHWEHPGDSPADSSGGVKLGRDDTFEVIVPGAVGGEVEVVTEPAPPDPQPDLPSDPAVCRHRCLWMVLAGLMNLLMLLVLWAQWMGWGPRRALWLAAALFGVLGLVLWWCLWRCLCREPQRGAQADAAAPPPSSAVPPDRVGGDSAKAGDATHEADAQRTSTVKADAAGVITLTGQDTSGRVIQRLCYHPGHGNPPWTTLARRGGTITRHESWTVPASMLLFPPHQTFELQARYTASLRAANGQISTPLGSAVQVSARFRTAGPPAYADALRNCVQSVYPFDGARPVYTGYDITVQFVEEYVPYLYTSVGEQLVIRLIDGQGQPVKDGAGQDLLLPASAAGQISRTTAERVWEDIYQLNAQAGCIAGPPVRQTGPTAVRLSPATTLVLTPNSQFIAQLVSDARPQVPLHAWGFTTSQFATFGELVTRGRLIQAPVAATSPLAGADFDTLAREAGVATVAYVQAFCVTPVLTADRGAVAALLLEAPEPLEFIQRLEVRVNGQLATPHPNQDSTRGLLVAAGGTWPLGSLALALTWRRDAGAGLPVLAVAGDTRAEQVHFTVEAKA